MTATVEAPAVATSGSPLASETTPRATFQLTRRLVGATRWPLVLLTAIYALNVADQYVVPTVFPLLKQEFGLSDSAQGVLAGSYVVVVTVFTLPFGYLADRHRRTRIISWGTAAWGFSMIFTGVTWNYGSLLVGRSALGAWDPCDNPTSQSLLADYYPAVQRSKVMSVYQVGQLLGIFLVPIAAGMATGWGWRAPFFFLAIPAFIVAILARRLPEPIRGQQDRLQPGLASSTAVPSRYDTMPGREAFKEVIKVKTVVLMTVSSGVGSLFFGSIGTWSPTFFVRYHDMTLTQAAGSLSLLALGGLTGALLSGWVADYVTYRGMRAGRVVVGAVARILALPLFVLTFSINNTPLMLVVFSLASMCLIAPQAPMNAARADVLHPSLRGRGTSVDIIVQSVAAAVAPILVGFLSDHYGLRAGFLIVVPLMGASGVILLLAVATYVKDEARVQRIVREEALAAVADGGGGPAPDDGGPGGGSDGGGSGGGGGADPVTGGPGGDALGAAVVGGEPAPAGDVEAAAASDIGSPEHVFVGATALIAGEAIPSNRTVAEGGDLLVIEDLDFAYGPIQILFGTNVTIPPGGVHALVGRNGVGKTTLLNCIAGLADGRSGRIVYDGLELTGVPAEQRVRLGITLMAGGRSTFPAMTVEENLWIGAYPFHEEHALVQQRLDAVLEIFPALKSRLRQNGGTLSGGEQQMVALGRALMAGPRLLLLDELSLGLAPMVTRELLRVVRTIRDLGTTVVIVEQSVPVALDVADTVMYMEKGEVTALGDAAALGDGESLVQMMMGGVSA